MAEKAAVTTDDAAQPLLSEHDADCVRAVLVNLFGQEQLSVQLGQQEFDPEWASRS